MSFHYKSTTLVTHWLTVDLLTCSVMARPRKLCRLNPHVLTCSSFNQGFGSRFCCRNRHQEFVFASKSDLQDATNLIIHYLNYLPTVQTDDSFRISQMLHDTLPQLISMSSQRVSAASNDSHNSADDSVSAICLCLICWCICCPAGIAVMAHVACSLSGYVA
jgi:hypothetical protein